MDYIIYTIEGYTQTPNRNDIENCQILDFQYNSSLTKQECLNKYLIENPTTETHFQEHEMRVVNRVSDEICNSIKEIVSYFQKEKADMSEEIMAHIDILSKNFNL